MYTVSRESVSLCQSLTYIGHFVSNNAKGKVRNAMINKFPVLYDVEQ